MNIENLSEYDLDRMKEFIAKLQESNPDIEYNIYPIHQRFNTNMDVNTKELIEKLSDRVEALERMIRTALDGHVLIDGKWTKLKI